MKTMSRESSKGFTERMVALISSGFNDRIIGDSMEIHPTYYRQIWGANMQSMQMECGKDPTVDYPKL
jgi:hypothetical protein